MYSDPSGPRPPRTHRRYNQAAYPHQTTNTQINDQNPQVLVMGAALDAVQLRRAEHELDVLEGGWVGH
jgi:hypothetical protein